MMNGYFLKIDYVGGNVMNGVVCNNKIEFSEYEKELMYSKKNELLYVMNANLTPEGYFINKAGYKSYLIYDVELDIVICSSVYKKLINDKEETVIGWFGFDENGLPKVDFTEGEFMMFPENCIGFLPNKELIVTKVLSIDSKENKLHLQYRSNFFTCTLKQAFIDKFGDVGSGRLELIADIVTKFLVDEVYNRQMNKL